MDYIIKNGWVVNGKGEVPFPGSLAVENGKIVEVSARTTIPADLPPDRILDADGGFITPGFIDIHRHGDWKILENGDDELLNRQGITTVVNGNCGLSVVPTGYAWGCETEDFLCSVTGRPPKSLSCGKAAEESICSVADYLSLLSGSRRSVNTGMLAGNGTMRASVKGYASGALSEEELRKLWKVLDTSLEAGVLGISLGLAYAPEFEYSGEELTRVLAPLRGTGIPITAHVRNEGDGLIPSLEEVIRIAASLEVPLHVSHMKCIGRKNWGSSCKKALSLFAEARQKGMRVDFDLYPYLTGSTQLVHLLPPEVQRGGTEQILRRLSDREYRNYLTEILKTPSMEFENIVELAGFGQIYASTLQTERFAPYAGWSIAEIARVTGQDPYDTLYDILLEERCQVTMLDTIASEEDMLTFLKDPHANLISDAIYPEGGRYHPRVYAAFPKLLIDYVQKQPVFSIQEAVSKMTAKPAAVFGLEQGTLEPGKPADINVFHLDKLKARADFENPRQHCSGFDYCLVNGALVLDHEKWNNAGSGSVIKRKGMGQKDTDNGR